MRKSIFGGGNRPGGGITGYPHEKIYEEVAYIAYHFHWARENIFKMEHRERIMWCDKISDINAKLNDTGKEVSIESI